MREAQNRWVRVQKARGSMPNNTGEFAARVEALRQRLDAAQMRLAGVAKQQNGLLESLARNELEQQKERIGTYQIQARFALASIYDRAASAAARWPRRTKAPPNPRAISKWCRRTAAPDCDRRRAETPPAGTRCRREPRTGRPAAEPPK